jgi:hypothetical protein
MRLNSMAIVPALGLVLWIGACSSSPPTALSVTPAAAPSAPAAAAGGSDRTATASSVDTAAAGSACRLLTLPEVSTATGRTMVVIADGGATGMCVFGAATDPSNVLYLQVRTDPSDISGLKQQLEALSMHVPGLGDDAFWNATAGEVFVQKGARAFSVILPSLANLTSTPDAVRSRMVALARSVLSRW